jgi:multiple sugar transport system permease protein
VTVFQYRSWRWTRTRVHLFNFLFVVPHLLFFLIFLACPVIFGLWISFHHWEIISPKKPFVGLENYAYLFSDDLFYRALYNTVRFALLTTVFETITGLFLALLVNYPFPGQTSVRVAIFAPRVLSVATMGIIWQWLLNRDWGFVNYVLSLLGIAAVNWLGDPNIVIPSVSMATIWWVIGYPMIVYLAGLQQIPEHLYEAARIDGANRWQELRYITIPLLAPTTLFIVVTAFIAHMQVFGQIYLMTQGGPFYSSISIVMYLYDNGFRYFRMGYAAAMAFTLAAIIFIGTLIQFKLLSRRIEY